MDGIDSVDNRIEVTNDATRTRSDDDSDRSFRETVFRCYDHGNGQIEIALEPQHGRGWQSMFQPKTEMFPWKVKQTLKPAKPWQNVSRPIPMASIRSPIGFA